MDEPNTERVITPLSKSFVQRLDDYRFATRAPSRAEAIRRLLELGLAAASEGRAVRTASDQRSVGGTPAFPNAREGRAVRTKQQERAQ